MVKTGGQNCPQGGQIISARGLKLSASKFFSGWTNWAHPWFFRHWPADDDGTRPSGVEGGDDGDSRTPGVEGRDDFGRFFRCLGDLEPYLLNKVTLAALDNG